MPDTTKAAFRIGIVVLASTLEAHVMQAEESSCSIWDRLWRSTSHCARPTSVAENTLDTTKVDADVAKIASIAKIGATIEHNERAKLVRQALDPKVYSWSEVEYRFCLAFESCRISRETYEQLLHEGRSSYRDRELLDQIHSVLEARRRAYETYRFSVTGSQSKTVGHTVFGSGGTKRGTVSAQCPGYAVRDGKATYVKDGGCYGPEYSPQGATGVVSQTGEGRTSCTLIVTCKLSEATIEDRMSQDESALWNATPQDFQQRVQGLKPIKFP